MIDKMAGYQDEFKQEISSLGELSSEYVQELTEVLACETKINQTEELCAFYLSQLQDISSKLRILPAAQGNTIAIVEAYSKLTAQTKIQILNLEVRENKPHFINSLDSSDGGIVLEFLVPISGSQNEGENKKTMEINVTVDRDDKMKKIKVFKVVLDERQDVTSLVTEEIENTLELQHLGYLVKKLKVKFGTG